MRGNLATADTRPTLGAAARAIAKKELVEYILRTPASERAMARAERVLPLGVASSFQFYEPHPIVMRAGQGRTSKTWTGASTSTSQWGMAR
jgi:hypothetical protein